jgi:uncharacterized membrane protein YgdD (TMEM256/DUF423 family)
MSTTQARYFRIAAGAGGAAVVLGAFGAHGLEERLSPEMLDIWNTAVQYHFYHAIALLAFTAGSLPNWERRWSGYACGAWTLGVAIFSGTLYLLALTGTGWLGAITPIGGVAMILGWIFAAFSLAVR